MFKMTLAFGLSCALLVCAFSSTDATEQEASSAGSVYPQGDRFPLGLYSIHTLAEMQEAKDFGWNMAHRYSFKADFLDIVKQSDMQAFAHLSDKEEAAAKDSIEQLSVYDCLAWWDLPEEQRHWREDEFNLIKNLTAWTRKYDPKKRPNFMYIPGHYTADAVAKYVPYLDIIGAGAYTEYSHQPHAWVRWRMESEIEAIEKAGYKVGSDYLNGEKTPIGIPMCFQSGKYMDAKHDVITPIEAYHDFYSCIASGARGILIFSYWHKRDLPMLEHTYAAYAKAASEIAGPEKLGQVILFGKDYSGVEFEITSGPQNTYAFRPYGFDEDIIYPSLNVLAKEWNDSLYLIAVNSAEKGIKATIKGVPAGQKEVEVLFEDRTIAVENGQFEDSFRWLGVHIYKLGKGDE